MKPLRRLFRLPASERRARELVSDELSFHIDERIEELVHAGRSREEAEREVRRKFGDVARIGALCEAIDRQAVRAEARSDIRDGVRRDAAYAARGLLRRPAFALVVIVTLAIGIGANTAIFGAVHSVLMRPIPASALDRLVVIRNELPSLPLHDAAVSPLEWMDLAARTDLFEASAAYTAESFAVTGFGEPVRVEAARTLGAYFDVLEMRPLHGRLYRPENSENGEHRVVVLSHALFQRLAGGDPGFVGRMVELNGEMHEVIGVLRPGVAFPRGVEMWAPFVVTPRVRSPQQRASLYMTALARVRPGAGDERVRAEMRAEAKRWQEEHGGTQYDPATLRWLSVHPLAAWVAGPLRQVLLVLMGATTLVLLIACANVASLQLVRAAGRARELAVRTALGAGRWTLARQLLIESLILAIFGGLAGLGVAALILRVLGRTPAEGYDPLQDVRLHGPALAFTAGVTIVAVLLFGLIPALRASRVNLNEQLREAGRGATGSRHGLLRGIVIVQMALTLVLLLGSGLMIRSLAQLIATDPGFRPEQVSVFRLSLPSARYETPEQRRTAFGEVVDRIRGVPGVLSVGTTTNLPFDRRTNSTTFRVVDLPDEPGSATRHANLRFVGGDYFRALGIPLLRGRALNDTDRMDAPGVVVIDEQLAREYFGDRNPIGHRVSCCPEATIVGVVGSVKHAELDEPAKATLYYPVSQHSWIGALHLAVRSTLPPETVAARMRSLVLQVDANLPIYEATTLPRLIDLSLGARRLAMTLLAGFAAVSLLLALLGVYGVLSYGTAERTREIGIRMALGARPGDVVRMVLRSGVTLAVIGLIGGAGIFLFAQRVLRGLLYGVSANDPLTIISSIAILTAAATVACWLPARRAAGVSPVVALKE